MFLSWTREKTADGRPGRNVTRAMENWAKPRTRHTHVHGPLHGPVNGLYVDTGKNGRRPSWTKRDARHGKLGKTTYEPHARTRTLIRTRDRALHGHMENTTRRSSYLKRDARHGKVGKTMYEAHARTRTLTRTRERAVRGHGKKRPTAFLDET